METFIRYVYNLLTISFTTNIFPLLMETFIRYVYNLLTTVYIRIEQEQTGVGSWQVKVCEQTFGTSVNNSKSEPLMQSIDRIQQALYFAFCTIVGILK